MLKRRKTVAVVDDDPAILKAAERLLEAYGFATVVFSSAEEFLDCKDVKEIDCLLLDVHLAGMSGIELRRQLTAVGSTLPVIFMTASDSEAIRDEAVEVGCVAFLRKPIPARQLFDVLENVGR